MPKWHSNRLLTLKLVGLFLVVETTANDRIELSCDHTNNTITVDMHHKLACCSCFSYISQSDAVGPTAAAAASTAPSDGATSTASAASIQRRNADAIVAQRPVFSRHRIIDRRSFKRLPRDVCVRVCVRAVKYQTTSTATRRRLESKCRLNDRSCSLSVPSFDCQ